MPVFNPNIPQATDALSQSQLDILNNFQAIAPLFEQDILQWVDLPVQAVAPTFAAGDEGLYNLNYATTAKNELFVHKQTFAGTAEVPMTASILSTTGSPGTVGWTYLPSGILLKWGRTSVTTDPQLFTIPTGSTPAYTQIFNIYLTPMDTSSNTNFTLGLRSITGTTAFTIYCTNPTAATFMNYLIIGY